MSRTGPTFRTGEPLLQALLDEIHVGATQLPDFQRGWVWDDTRISKLLASLSLSYPIGAVMLMETGGQGVSFAPRPVQGVKLASPVAPSKLILDGQQRLTSLYLALRSGQAVETTTEKKQVIKRHYYLDMAKCLDDTVDRVDAIVGVPEDRIVRSDFNRKIDLDVSTQAHEHALGLFPVSLVFDAVRFGEWKIGYQEHHQYAPEKMRFLNRFEQEIWLRFQQYKVPVIELLKGTPKEAVCEVFENVNTGGVALTVFELVTATFAADDFRLRDEWAKIRERVREQPVLEELSETEFLQSVTLLASRRRVETESRGVVSCKRRDILQLTLDEFKTFAPMVEKGLGRAARLLIREKVFDTHNLPYQTQFVPLAAICAVLGDQFDADGVKQKLARWYWCGVFGELYGGATETRFALDLVQVPAWIAGGPEPRTIADASVSPTRLLTLSPRLSAAYKGVTARLMRVGSLDFLTGDPIELTTYMDDSVDIHHIFPQAYSQKQGFQKTKWNCVVNKAPLTAKTNRKIGGNAPSSYLAAIEKGKSVTPTRLDEILATHAIEPSLLRGDDFDAFLRARATRLLDLIADAMGKPVSGRDTDEVKAAFGGPLVA